MKTGRAAVAFLALCGLSVRAFVVEVNSNGDPLRWHLDPPEPAVPPNPEGQGVHTNVVNPATRAVLTQAQDASLRARGADVLADLPGS